jgi:energy-coupling factor transporter ATP-binding protein EcfA2
MWSGVLFLGDGYERYHAIRSFTVTGLSKRYGATVALDKIELTVGKGSIHAILGENGAGKSTLMESMVGVVTPDEGHIELDGGPSAHSRSPRCSGYGDRLCVSGTVSDTASNSGGKYHSCRASAGPVRVHRPARKPSDRARPFHVHGS